MSKYLQTETYSAPDLGDVEIRSLLLSERMAMADFTAEKQGEIIPYMLACCVLKNSTPVFSKNEWDEYGARYQDEALEMFYIANRLSGFSQAEIEKKPQTRKESS